jgi:serine/threonine protein kinase
MGQTEAPPILLDSDGDIGDTGGMKRTEGEIFCKGSLWYLSPEELEPELFRKRDAALSEPEARKKGDVWALGVVLYGMVTGKLPFTDDFLPRLQMTVTSGEYPALPDSFTPALRDLVSKLLTVDIVLRPSIDMVLAHPWLKT